MHGGSDDTRETASALPKLRSARARVGRGQSAKEASQWLTRASCMPILPSSIAGGHGRVAYSKEYGITPENRESLISDQGGRCAIYRDRFDIDNVPCIDHCHVTKQVPGALCKRCNVALGMLGDDPALARGAADYLDKWKACLVMFYEAHDDMRQMSYFRRTRIILLRAMLRDPRPGIGGPSPLCCRT